MTNANFCLKLSCPDRPGIVSRVTELIYTHGGNIREAAQFEDAETENFFMRVVFVLNDPFRLGALEAAFGQLTGELGLNWTLRALDIPRKTLIMTSKFDHCLIDLLYRNRIGELPMDVVAIVSNHPRTALEGVEFGVIPYHYLPITPKTKELQEARLMEIVRESGAELVVLARYMQILSDALSAALAGKCINIHHSFLPGFKGAKPYHQAHQRGVKMIGATAHYVSDRLDEGPIIVQDVEQITHADMPDNLIRKGRDIERRVLARAVRYHLQDRVFLNGGKTVVFTD